MSNYLVLIIDDDQGLRDLLEMVLSQVPGIVTIVAVDGCEGILQATNRIPDLIVLDMMMPGRSGAEVAVRLKAQPSTMAIPIIGMSSAFSKRAAVLCGCDEFLDKPFGIDDFLEVVERYRAGTAPESTAVAG